MQKKIRLDYILYIFFIIQPFIGMYRAFFGDNLKLLGFSLLEMINTFLILGMLLLVCLRMQDKRKILWLITGFVLLGIYCIFHSYNMTKFNTDIMTREMYGLIKESYYIFRVYGLPVILLFVCIFGKFKKELFVKIICDVAMLVCTVIVITNLFELSFCTYKTEFHEYLVQGNIFSWFFFNGNENMDYFTSIGWFESGNEISGLLMISLPVIVYEGLCYRSWKSILRLITCILAMLMIGTKTAVLGSIAVLVIIAGLMVVYYVVQRKKRECKGLAIGMLCGLVIWCGLFYFSPFLQDIYPHSNSITSETVEQIEEVEKEGLTVRLSDETEADRAHAIEYIQNGFWNHFVNEQYIQLYPIENDLPYWIEVFNRNAAINQNYRFFKTQLVSRIIERNNRFMDKLVGIGVIQEINTERDYTYQYAMFGIVGVMLLLGLYIMIFVKGGVLFFIKQQLRWNVEYMTYLCSLGIALALPYVSGHMFGVSIVMYAMVLSCALVWKKMEQSKL